MTGFRTLRVLGQSALCDVRFTHSICGFVYSSVCDVLCIGEQVEVCRCLGVGVYRCIGVYLCAHT